MQLYRIWTVLPALAFAWFHDDQCAYNVGELENFNQFESKKEGKNKESIQSSTLPDPGYPWESDNFTIRDHKQEPRGQSFPSR